MPLSRNLIVCKQYDTNTNRVTFLLNIHPKCFMIFWTQKLLYFKVDIFVVVSVFTGHTVQIALKRLTRRGGVP
jgi:hypothetical protein